MNLLLLCTGQLEALLYVDSKLNFLKISPKQLIIIKIGTECKL